MSIRCLKCFRPVQTCYCRYISAFDPGVKFVFLMHPVEAYQQRTGTGRLASLSLEKSEIIIDRSFDKNRRVAELIAHPNFYPMVLYPGKESRSAGTIDFKSAMEGRTLLIFLVDGTWDQARKMMYYSPCLQRLPRLSFSQQYRSRFTIKTQPAEHCLSTIESVYYLIGELRESGVVDPAVDPRGLMDVFHRMVKFQEESRTNRFLERSCSI